MIGIGPALTNLLGKRLNFGVVTNDDLAHRELLNGDLGF